MVISQLPQLMVKTSPSEQVSNNDSFLQPALPRRNHSCTKNGNTKVFHKDLNMIVESDDDETIHAGGESPIIEEHEHEHEVIDSYETNSAASSLTRMYVSDEEDKHDLNLMTTV